MAKKPKEFKKLFLKCHDASVFQEKNNHEILSQVFYDDRHADQILQQDQYFIIGEKGTGKTIIAQYLSNIRTDKNCSVLDFASIDFDTFRKLTQDGHLKYIQADHLWQVLLLSIAAEKVVAAESGILATIKFQAIYKALSEFYEDRFSGEFPVVIQILDKVDAVAKLTEKHLGELGISTSSQASISFEKQAAPLNRLRENFIDAFTSAKVGEDHVIFIDRIDIKPDDVEYEKFIKALSSLVRAILYLNENVFTKMKGRSRIKFVMLMRPDIFDKLNLQNQSARASDNSVILNWNTTYAHHRNSTIFALADKFLGKQAGLPFGEGQAWDHFVDPDVSHFAENDGPENINRSFREFLRLSWFRPRDIIRSLHICQEQPECVGHVDRRVFERALKDFSNYLYGEVKDFSRFYFSDDTFDLIERFFSEVQKLDKITYDSFMSSHKNFIQKIQDSPVQRNIDPRVLDPEEFLQILYSSNIICWRMKNDFDGVDDYWAFRERTPAQLEPKVGLYCEYAVHYGLRRALRLNRKVVSAVRD